MTFDVEKTRKDFPILSREIQGNNLTYLDNAASSQKPIDVLEGIKQFESNDYSNVHRGLHTLSVLSTSAYEESRKIVQKFLNAKSLDPVKQCINILKFFSLFLFFKISKVSFSAFLV